ncbi:unnamed protein product [Ixodes hexagonus]
MASERELRTVERINLRNIINQWNANRLDLFELSEPNEDLEFHGVMRFYFQDADQKVVTKCIRVSSTASVHDVVCTLIEKFRPDIRMLSIPDYTDYALYEIHENGEERKLGGEEKPLLVQLNWHKDDREGRFLFRRMDEKSRLPSLQGESLRFGRKLSKREKRDKKKRDKKEAAAGRDGIAEKLYTELPETSFTRSISNPEAVMRRRRQQKLERKLQQFRQEGSPEAGGTLRIFGESLNRDVPYKTLLLSTTDTSSHVVKEILDKYGMDQEEPLHYCLVQVLLPPVSPGEASPLDHPGQPGGILGSIQGVKEYILDDDDCPLAIERQHNRLKGTLSFHIRRRPADYQPRKRKKKPSSHGGTEPLGPPMGPPMGPPVVPQGGGGFRCGSLYDRLPFLLAVHPEGGQPGPRHRILLNMTEVGSAPSGTQCLQLQGPGIHPRHCVIAHTEGVVTVTPSHQEAEIYLDGCRVYDTTILQHGALVRFGRHHTFRFLEPDNQPNVMSRDGGYPPEYAERSRPSCRLVGEEDLSAPYEGAPDAGETASVHSHRTEDAGPPPGGDNRRGDPILPAVLEFWEEHEAVFLEAVVGQLDWASVQFKLAPTYTLYMACRYRASTHFRPEISPAERAQRLTALANHLGVLVRTTVERRSPEPGPLALWLANASELLHFLRQDRHLSAYTLDAQDLLTEAVQLAFRHLVAAQRRELAQALPRAFLESRDPGADSAVGEVLAVLAGSMSLLRRCRVNAALTIQLFSWLFHHVNMWLFNSLLAGSCPCNRQTGSLLKRRLAHLVAWAEKQGLELAADCHLARIIQAAHLLQTPKGSGPEEVASISSACFKLNSLQLRHLLECYEPCSDEAPISPSLVEGVVRVAQQTADQQAHAEGRPLRLQEDPDLQLPFLLPEDGYSCDIVRGVPPGLQEFLQPLALSGLCRLTLQPTSLGYWTIYMSDQDVLGPPPVGAPEQQQTAAPPPGRPPPAGQGGTPRGGPSPPEVRTNGRGGRPPVEGPQVATITLHKSSNGMGLSIVAARGTNQDRLGIYIKSVVKGGAADQDGRLQAGDQLLRVDGHSLVGITQEKAADLMTQTGQVVNLEVAKQGAIHHGLAALLCQPSPLMHRGPRRLSERDIPSRLAQEDRGHPPGYRPRIQGSKSVPVLNTEYELASTLRTEISLADESSANASEQRGFICYEASISDENKTKQHVKHSHQNFSRLWTLHGSRVSHWSAAPIHTSRDYPHFQEPPPSYSTLPSQPPKPGPRPDPQLLQQQQQHAAMVQEERQYQNIGMYQQQQPLPATPPPAFPDTAMGHQGGRVPAYHSSQPQLARGVPPGGVPRGDQSSRPLSTLVSPREQEQYASGMGFPSQRTAPQGLSPKRAQGRPQEGTHPPQRPPMPAEMRSLAGEADVGSLHRAQPSMPLHQRDLLRQEAKMEEMKEEVRRREEREQHSLQQQQWAASQRGVPVGPNDWTAQGPQQAAYRYAAPPPANHRGDPRLTSPAHVGASNGHRDQHGHDGDPDPTAKVLSPSPWEREEKEMSGRLTSSACVAALTHGPRRMQRLEGVRLARDEEVRELECLPERSARQEERLRTLRLEQEFERRAQEAVRAHGDEEEEDDEVTPLLSLPGPVCRLLKREPCWIWAVVVTNGCPKTAPPSQEQEGRLRQLRLEENGKKQELEAQRRAEERLLREAQRRRQQQEHQQQQHQQQPGEPRVARGAEEEPPPLPACPPPPVHEGAPRPPKKVSFHETPTELAREDANGNPEEEEEEEEGEDMQASSSSYLVGNTPGVIGAQEVYRDPRQRIERQRALEQPARPPGPEKLTFREKMRMFARETGEDHTPRDKMKISRAQREIETNLNGVVTPHR